MERLFVFLNDHLILTFGLYQVDTDRLPERRREVLADEISTDGEFPMTAVDENGVAEGTGQYSGMILIPAGPFEMGSSDGEGRPDEACGGTMGFSPWGATLGPNSSCEKSDNDPVD